MQIEEQKDSWQSTKKMYISSFHETKRFGTLKIFVKQNPHLPFIIRPDKPVQNNNKAAKILLTHETWTLRSDQTKEEDALSTRGRALLHAC